MFVLIDPFELVDPPWPTGDAALARRWDPPAVIHPDAPVGYGVEWGPVGDRYAVRPRGHGVEPPRPRVAEAIVLSTHEIVSDDDDALPKTAKRLMRQVTAAGRLGRVTHALAEIQPTALRKEAKLCSSIAIRWRAIDGSPAGAAVWIDGGFDRAVTRDGRRVPAAGLAEAVAGPGMGRSDDLTTQASMVP